MAEHLGAGKQVILCTSDPPHLLHTDVRVGRLALGLGLLIWNVPELDCPHLCGRNMHPLVLKDKRDHISHPYAR